MTRTIQRAAKETLRSTALEEEARRLARSFGLHELGLLSVGGSLVLDGAAPSYQAKKLAGAAAELYASQLGLRLVNRLRVIPAGPFLVRPAVREVRIRGRNIPAGQGKDVVAARTRLPKRAA